MHILGINKNNYDIVLLYKGVIDMQKPYKVKVSISLDENVIESIKELAEEDDRNFSQYINTVLKKHISEHNKNNENTDI